MKIVIIVLISLLVLIAGVVALAFSGGFMESIGSFRAEPPGTEVRAEPAARAALIETVSAPGEIEPHTKVDIAAVVSARITELPFREGDEVKKGDIIGQLDDRDLKAILLAARAQRDGQEYSLMARQSDLDGQKARLAYAESDLRRMTALYDSGDKSMSELEGAKELVENLQASVASTTHAISVAESALEAASADVGRAEDSLNNTTIVAPMDGVITLLNSEVGEIVTGSTTNPGTVIMTIADLSRMVLKARVAESDVADVRAEQQAKIYINAYPDKVYSGTVRQIALQRSGTPDGTGFFVTEVEIDLQGHRIFSGLVANVDIEIKQHDGVVVPQQAIVARDIDDLPDDIRDSDLVDRTKSKVNVLFRIVDGKAVCTPVRPGASDLTHRLITKGLEEGELVIVGPLKVLTDLKHDQRVKAADEKKADEVPKPGDGEPGTEPGTETGPETGTETGTEAGTESGTESGAESGPEPGTGAEVEPAHGGARA